MSSRNPMDESQAELSSQPKTAVSQKFSAMTRPRPGESFTLEPLKLRMIWVNPGSFLMGVENGEPDELPLTQVKISQGYWLGACEVTQMQWDMLMQDDPSYFKDVNKPVDSVSWTTANLFCERLSELARLTDSLPAGFSFRLPTEAQWEYACRAGHRGENPEALFYDSWYFENSGNVSHAVGKKDPNAWGFHDLQGNVWEWCSDWYESKLPGESAVDPTGPRIGTSRVYRGGGWFSVPQGCRRSNRAYAAPGYHCNDLGFRLGLTPD